MTKLFDGFAGVIFQRMAALKRAYADTILNTAKESAARILASEQRALQLQRDLSLAKAESLALLLRLKAVMDAKVRALALYILCRGLRFSSLFLLKDRIFFFGNFTSRYYVFSYCQI